MTRMPKGAEPPGAEPKGAEPAHTELVVLLDPRGRAVGTTAKAGVHHNDTPLHLAFSCYVVDPLGRLLVTRRALGKTVFPGLWTNTLCGHPMPGESLVEALRRRALGELGMRLGRRQVDLVLPEFGYRAEMDGVVEHEMCPVLLARVEEEPRLCPDEREVEDTAWMPWTAFVDAVLGGAPGWSPWCREQVQQLQELGPDPTRWSVADSDRLPPAARLS